MQLRLMCLHTCHKAGLDRAARPRREDDGVGRENDGFLRRKPAHIAERQQGAVPDKPEEQHVRKTCNVRTLNMFQPACHPSVVLGPATSLKKHLSGLRRTLVVFGPAGVFHHPI